MSITTISKKGKKKIEKNQHIGWFHVMTKQKSIVVLGCKGQERYELFSSYLSPGSVLQEVWQNLKYDKTYVLYPGLKKEIYTRDENGIKRSIDLLLKENDQIVFIPVHPKQLLNGSYIVLPPALLETDNFSIITDPIIRNERAEYIWVEAFPYGKSESFNALRRIEKEYEIPKHKLHFAFIHSKRKFSYTDLDTQNEAIEAAKQIYQQQEIKSTIHKIQSPLTPFSTINLMSDHVKYTDVLVEEMKQIVEKNERYYNRFFEDDYLDMVVDLSLPTRLEQLFDYRIMRMSNQRTVFDGWIDQMNKFVKNDLHPQIHKLLVNGLELDHVYPMGNYNTDLDKLLGSEWDKFLIGLEDEKEQSKSISKSLNAVEFAMASKEVKMILKQKLTNYIEKQLYMKLFHHIQFIYGLWKL